MTLDTLIDQTPEPRTIRSLTEDLKRLGVDEGMTLLVHSSLSSMGWVCGAEVAVIQALLNALGETGTLVMPAQSTDYTDPASWECPPVPASWCQTIRDNMPPFDPHTTPTARLGRIAACFRTWPGTLRSDHPSLSFCAKGPDAEDILQTHRLGDSFGLDSPLGALYRRDTRILLLGVGHEANTSLHLSECLADIRPRKRKGAAIMQNGERAWVWYSDSDYDSDEFPQIGSQFEKAHPHFVDKGSVGSAESRLLPMKELVDFATNWFRIRA